MARITVHAVHADGAPRRWTLSERIVAEHLESDHYAGQLLERLSWATADAEALESDELNADLAEDAPRVQLRTRTRGDKPTRRSGKRPVTPGRRRAP